MTAVHQTSSYNSNQKSGTSYKCELETYLTQNPQKFLFAGVQLPLPYFVMATYQLAVIFRNPTNDDEFLLVKQNPPPKFNDQEYDSYVDSDLWDLPSAKLSPLSSGDEDSPSEVVLNGQESCSQKVNLMDFDLSLALDQVLGQVGFRSASVVEWKFLKFVEEPNFGPGYPVETVYAIGKLVPDTGTLKENSKWSCTETCLNWILQGKPVCDRLGPLVVDGLLKDSMHSESLKISPTLSFQDYPPGVKVIPMRSRTAKPYSTTNLVVFAPGNNHINCGSGPFVAQADAMIVDPGCRHEFNEELAEIVAALPRKLIVFVTHHHHDHVDGLSIVQKSNPDARLLVHENTIRRITKDDWSLGYTAVSGEEEICIGGQKLRVVFAPGHTDGHLALLHIATHSLIVGDHCVGQGSALLDINSGGDMSDYFQTTYRFLELSPNALIPMHGRINLWPKHMLCGYLKNRRNRESIILKAIEDGCSTLFDIVAYTYSDVNRNLWVHAASNVRLHVDHLSKQDKLPKELPVAKFQSTCGVHFISRWMLAYLKSLLPIMDIKLPSATLLGAVTLSSIAVLFYVRNNLNSR